jgi:hypothetical protein
MSEKELEKESKEEHEHKNDGPSSKGGLSRRELVTGGLVAVGAGLTPLPALAARDQEQAVGTGGFGTMAAEFRARFAQTGSTGEHFAGYGYITSARGLTDDDLFGGQPLGEGTALLTAYAEGELVRRTLDQSVHSLDIEGTLTVYQRDAAGASFDDPSSFQVGTVVAQYSIALQDIVTVFAPGKGLPTLTGDMRQTSASHLAGTSLHRKFGSVGARARLYATGIGTLIDPATFNSVLEMAGNWTMK